MAFNRGLMALAVMLPACGQGPTHVNVSGGFDDVRFSAIAPKGDGPVCVDKLSVMPAARDDAKLMWQIVAIDPEKCLAELRYGEPTDKYAQTAPATPLRSEVAYRVRISGAGFGAVRDFRLTPEGVTVLD